MHLILLRYQTRYLNDRSWSQDERSAFTDPSPCGTDARVAMTGEELLSAQDLDHIWKNLVVIIDVDGDGVPHGQLQECIPIGVLFYKRKLQGRICTSAEDNPAYQRKRRSPSKKWDDSGKILTIPKLPSIQIRQNSGMSLYSGTSSYALQKAIDLLRFKICAVMNEMRLKAFLGSEGKEVYRPMRPCICCGNKTVTDNAAAIWSIDSLSIHPNWTSKYPIMMDFRLRQNWSLELNFTKYWKTESVLSLNNRFQVSSWKYDISKPSFRHPDLASRNRNRLYRKDYGRAISTPVCPGRGRGSISSLRDPGMLWAEHRTSSPGEIVGDWMFAQDYLYFPR